MDQQTARRIVAAILFQLDDRGFHVTELEANDPEVYAEMVDALVVTAGMAAACKNSTPLEVWQAWRDGEADTDDLPAQPEPTEPSADSLLTYDELRAKYSGDDLAGG